MFNNTIITTQDGGLCNRLYNWTMLRAISDYYKMKILVDWIEVEQNALYLPDTSYFDIRQIYTNNLINEFIKINTSHIVANHPSGLKLDSNKNYCFTCAWGYNRNLTDENKRINEIELNQAYKDKIDSFLSQYRDIPMIGMHVRRGDYRATDKFIPRCPFRIPDEWFFNTAKKILNRYPNAIFFLATDGTESEKKFFFDNLPVVTISNDGSYRQDVLELFTLAKMKMIMFSASTYSMIAGAYGNKKSIIWPSALDQSIDTKLQEFQEL